MASRRRRIVPVAAPLSTPFRHRLPVAIIGFQPRALPVRRLVAPAPRTSRAHLVARPRPIFHHTTVKLVPGRVVGRPGSRRVLLGNQKISSPKQRKLCKCTHERSDQQRQVSRKFFARGGGRGRAKKVHACAC